ncbi:phosphate ABC transporter substrate-binding protein PstS [Roseateles cellulosilyticus]|uniref:Phosphate-binding protein PstS n=1 Tax=Pelomonas cellulosilytica TaxID=2906762 RepID=A0ABS8Y1F4_9BURK|nr:phosphate ABC transporter substrate-binding protein PstS [Pelomonas sp. P8]MCE4557840.1 phosphate ABC transporter substrate-binding protein PstS [Pelomonas sp. P8]
MSSFVRLFLLLASLCSLSPAALAQAVTGQGATFPSKVYGTWAKAFEKAGGASVTYKGTGSGDGIKQISARQVDFGGTDSPLPAGELARLKLVQIPVLVGGVVPVVNLPGQPAGLQLDGELLADIFLGRVKVWNDIRIAAMNPGVGLPALPIRRIVRAEKSGTSEGFSRYLAGVSTRFKSEVPPGQLPAWPGEPVKAEGNDGMVQSVRSTPGAIAYVSYDRVLHDKLAAVRLRNAAGRFVSPTEAGFRAAILDSDMYRQGNDLASLLDRAAPEAWPITLTTFVLLDAEPAAAAQAEPALKFLYWCFMRGDDLTRGSGFAPLPVSVQSRLAARFTQVHPKDGQVPAYQVF